MNRDKAEDSGQKSGDIDTDADHGYSFLLACAEVVKALRNFRDRHAGGVLDGLDGHDAAQKGEKSSKAKSDDNHLATFPLGNSTKVS